MSAERPRGPLRAARRTLALGAGIAFLLPAGAGAAPGATVMAMVVGQKGVVLDGPRSVGAAGVNVAVAGRRCSVAAGTPLSVLAALGRLGGPRFALRDYGRCGASARNSGELFVYGVGGETNNSQNGWEYKVGNLAGATGAADTSGILGNGRLLRAGQRVLWFWCDSSAGGCQRTLEVSAPAGAAAGGTLPVRVRGYDNEGRGTPVGGAVVHLGSDFATTSGSGVASLIVPSTPGRYTLSAGRAGLVPAFPETIVVR